MAEPGLDPDVEDEAHRPSAVVVFIRERPILVGGFAVLLAAVAVLVSGPLSVAERRYRFGTRQTVLMVCRGSGPLTALTLLAGVVLVCLDARRSSAEQFVRPVAAGASIAAALCAVGGAVSMFVLVTLPAGGGGGVTLDRSRWSVVLGQSAGVVVAVAVCWATTSMWGRLGREGVWRTAGGVVIAAAAMLVAASVVAGLTVRGQAIGGGLGSGGFGYRLSLLVAAAVPEATLLAAGVALGHLGDRDDPSVEGLGWQVDLVAAATAALIVVTNAVMASLLIVRGADKHYYTPSSGVAADIAVLVAGGVVAAGAIVILQRRRGSSMPIQVRGSILATAAVAAIVCEVFRVMVLRPRAFASLGVIPEPSVVWQRRLQSFNQSVFSLLVLLVFGAVLALAGRRSSPVPGGGRSFIVGAWLAAGTAVAAVAHITVVMSNTRSSSLYTVFVGSKEGSVAALIAQLVLAAGYVTLVIAALPRFPGFGPRFRHVEPGGPVQV